MCHSLDALFKYETMSSSPHLDCFPLSVKQILQGNKALDLGRKCLARCLNCISIVRSGGGKRAVNSPMLECLEPNRCQRRLKKRDESQVTTLHTFEDMVDPAPKKASVTHRNALRQLAGDRGSGLVLALHQAHLRGPSQVHQALCFVASLW